MNFVQTSDKETYNKLLEEGFTFLKKDGKFWVFINNGVATFDTKEHVSYTNKLNI